MDASQAPAEPLLFTRILKEKVWGGRSLAARLALDLPFDGPLGETWELSDYPGVETTVRGGAFDGQCLRNLMEAHGPALLGESRPSEGGRFPLLVKFIEAADDLSVQVHPPDGPLSPTGIGKTEAWYILDTSDGGEVICGLRAGTARDEFERDAATSAVRDHLHPLPVSPGDCVFVPAGMTHAIRAGVTLCEVQQTSDVTYRMYDWDRLGLDGQPRETHVQEALKVVDYEMGPGEARRAEFGPVAGGAAIAPLAECDYFRLQAVRIAENAVLEPGGYARTLAVVKGAGVLEPLENEFEPRKVGFGDVVLLPASCAGARAVASSEGLEFLEGVAL